MSQNVRRNTFTTSNSKSDDDFMYYMTIAAVFLFLVAFLPGYSMVDKQRKLPEKERSGFKLFIGVLLCIIGIIIPAVAILNLIPWHAIFAWETYNLITK
jgi:heme/copper-type cytochrome/quinol oxidase subunit 2